MFGRVHIILMVMAAVLNVVFFLLVRRRRDDVLIKILFILGVFMMAAELFKQWFCFRYMFGGTISLVYFPWQLCSIAMYLSVLVFFTKGRIREGMLVYLCTFSLFGAVMALIVPKNMLLDEIVFTVHSFIYHALIISESVIALILLKRRSKPSFAPALVMFGITASVAEVINMAAKFIVNDPVREPNMFYISPFYPTTQTILSDIASRFGILVEVCIYLVSIVLISYLIFVIEKAVLFRKQTAG